MPLTYAQRKRVIARLIVKQRRCKRLSQRELARLSGMCQSRLSRFERACRMPDIHDLSTIAEAMGEKVYVLLPAEERPTPPASS